MRRRGTGSSSGIESFSPWFRKAADQGDIDAQVNLGDMSYKGDGIPLDYVQSYMWFSLSAAHGDAQAAKNRDIVGKLMTASQLAQAETLAAAWKPTTGR